MAANTPHLNSPPIYYNMTSIIISIALTPPNKRILPSARTVTSLKPPAPSSTMPPSRLHSGSRQRALLPTLSTAFPPRPSKCNPPTKSPTINPPPISILKPLDDFAIHEPPTPAPTNLTQNLPHASSSVTHRITKATNALTPITLNSSPTATSVSTSMNSPWPNNPPPHFHLKYPHSITLSLHPSPPPSTPPPTTSTSPPNRPPNRTPTTPLPPTRKTDTHIQCQLHRPHSTTLPTSTLPPLSTRAILSTSLSQPTHLHSSYDHPLLNLHPHHLP